MWSGSAPNSTARHFPARYHGKDDVRQFFADLDTAQEATRFEPTAFIAEGDTVVVMGNASWHVKSTGLDYDSDWVHVFTVRDGKVTRMQQFVDTAATEHAYRPTGSCAGAAAGPQALAQRVVDFVVVLVADDAEGELAGDAEQVASA